MKNFLGINWKIRFKSKVFWLALIPLVLVLIQQVGGVFGFEFIFDDLNNKLQALVQTIFLILGLLGIVSDNTTEGFTDTQDVKEQDNLYKE